MRRDGSVLRLSATDLAGHLACRHRTGLERAAAEGTLRAPVWRDPALDVLEERGREHEAAYLAFLREHGTEWVRLADVEGEDAVERTFAAMRRGVPAIAQATLRAGRWHGRADVLLRVETPSRLGDFCYEVVDTKLASETRGGTVLQLCLYSDLVRQIQGVLPERMHVVSPGRLDSPERFRTRDFFAYYHRIATRLELSIETDGAEEVYPEPVPHCEICRWSPRCRARWRDDDHLSLVAGATALQRRELCARGIATVEKLAAVSLPLDPKPARGSGESYARVREQARVQLLSRAEARPRFEALEPVEDGAGLARLPEPSAGDVYLDLEGDPFVERGGREYLFGWAVHDEHGTLEYRRSWALDLATERAAFEGVVDELIARWERDPGFHVYHFGAYEPGALKRLMGRHATREAEIDRLLRGERLVDLHRVTRQAFRVGVERYGLKELEAVHGFTREIDLREASIHRHAIERALELGQAASISAEASAAVEAYNRDDCLSTQSLHGWLEGRRSEAVARGVPISRPQPGSGEPPEPLDERARRVRALFDRLTRDVPADPESRTAEQRARWLLAHLLDWHRREDKATWWEFFRLRDLPEDELLGEKRGLGGLSPVGRAGGTEKCPIHRYRFPEQDHDLRAGDTLFAPGAVKLGSVDAIDLAERTIDVKKREDSRELHPKALYAHDWIDPRELALAVERLALDVAANGLERPGALGAAPSLLLRRPPPAELHGGSLVRPGEGVLQAARRLALELGEGVLPVQGPPGSGKTYLGARLICALVRAGKKVGLTALSHKVIRKLIDKTLEAASEEGLRISIVQKPGEKSASVPAGLVEVTSNDGMVEMLARADVGAGTPFLWSREEMTGRLDVLVVDEAGQMSLADALAASQAARSVILLGDPQQLEQPVQGSHPEGCAVSALEHLLGDHDTLRRGQGLFLPETWRLHPAICRFTSELFYEGRLRSETHCARQALVGATPFAGAGLWFVPVEHDGNQSASPEEAERVEEIVRCCLVTGDVAWIDRSGARKPLTLADVLIVAPFNAQVGLLKARLPEANVGTVDRFQGQEAPVVIYSMTTSTPEDAPRGLEFLYSLHRLNVASSRARCVCVLVASPRLLEPECRTPRQMRLANALCRYVELARVA